MNRKSFFIGVLTVFGLSPALLTAQPPPPDDRRGGGRPFPEPTPEMKEEFRQKVGITEQQQAQIDSMFKETFQKRRDLGKKMRQQFDARQKVGNVYELDRNQLRAINNEIQKINAQILALHVEAEEKIRRILNKEQFTKMVAFREEGMKKWHAGDRQRKGGGTPP